MLISSKLVMSLKMIKEVIEILATYDPETKSGSGFKGRKPNGTIHFVESKTALAATFNYFFPLLTQNNDFNQESWQIKQGFVENNLAQNTNHTRIQF